MILLRIRESPVLRTQQSWEVTRLLCRICRKKRTLPSKEGTPGSSTICKVSRSEIIMRQPSATKIARAWILKTAKDLPADVERYVEEGKESGMDEGKAWAIAWSRFCKYKNPGSDHCKQNPSVF